MDAILDLAARATSFITLLQDTFVKDRVRSGVTPEILRLSDIFSEDFRESLGENLDHCIKAEQNARNAAPNSSSVQHEPVGMDAGDFAGADPSCFHRRALELVWISSKEPNHKDAAAYTQQIMVGLLDWIYGHREVLLEKLKSCDSLPTPYNWREAICDLLYITKGEPARLAAILQYLPIQVVLVAGEAKEPLKVKDQRLMQLWLTKPEEGKYLTQLLNGREQKRYYRLHTMTSDRTEMDRLINDSDSLTSKLRETAPLSFDQVFSAELQEIGDSRIFRNNERCAVNALQRKRSKTDDGETEELSADPMVAARQMELFALALSGGGIRSATFNLGIMQALAREGLISQVDYLSTVSGGGYIGSWLAAWIQRDGSVNKVSDRLNPDKSPDPFAEEVRPIRWLRMFSNYFTPMASIMSIDAWTVGATWLRNTLLNQFIIVLMLLAGLLGIRFFYEVWARGELWQTTVNGMVTYVAGSILVLSIALLGGLGMRAYHDGKLAFNPVTRAQTKRISKFITAIAFAGAFVVSASMFWRPAVKDLSLSEDVVGKFRALLPAFGVMVAALFIIALIGKYHVCITSYGKSELNRSQGKSLINAMWKLFGTAVVSALIGTFCLVLGWELLHHIKVAAEVEHPLSLDTPPLPGLYEGLAFILGIPIVLLVFGITVVARMALLGRYFPDERREWWGRMGAQICRAAFVFTLFAGSSLLGLVLANRIVGSNTLGWKAPATFGGWVALVGSSVKAAFSSKTSGKGDEKGMWPNLLNVLSKAGPYLFALGLLAFLPALLIPLYEKDVFQVAVIYQNNILKTALLMVACALPALWLARRVGVNEFSMHHLYRNRLVRAYLGATRRRTDRKKTANPFTNFDTKDDLKLSKLVNRAGYYGPYPILNTALNASSDSSLDRQDRKAESFIFSPLYCGFDFSMTRASANVQAKSYDYGYRPTESFAYTSGDGGPCIGTAMAISGAAVNPNQGYHSSSATAFLLTVFNVQLGWWIGNPRKSKWRLADPDYGLGYIISNLTGSTSTRQNFVCLSDGGHFDNMGLYELVRRRCTFIILGDGEQDDQFTCEGLANAIRRCRIDFGAEIDINVEPIRNRDEHRLSKSHYAVGSIRYAGEEEPSGVLLYMKSSITGKEPVDVLEYSIKNTTFPHQTTADQFFDEAQFESYRQLGLHVASTAFNDPAVVEKLRLERLPERAQSQLHAGQFLSDFFGAE